MNDTENNYDSYIYGLESGLSGLQNIIIENTMLSCIVNQET